MAQFVKYVGYSTIRQGVSIHFVEITVDTAADIPEPQDNWETGSWLHVLEGGGSLYTLGNDRAWHPQSFTAAEVTA